MGITFIKYNTPSLPQKNDLHCHGPRHLSQRPAVAASFFCRVLVPALLVLPGGTVGGGGGPGSPGTVGIGRGLCHIILRRLWGIHVITVAGDTGVE